MEKTLEELRQEADELGVTYHKTISADKLQAKIDAAKETDEVEEVEVVKVEPKAVKPVTKDEVKASIRSKIKAMEKANMESVVIKLTMVDKREASTATSVYLGNEEVGFHMPLDVFVEVPKIIANMAEEARCQVHMDNGTTSVTKNVKKFVVDYKK